MADDGLLAAGAIGNGLQAGVQAYQQQEMLNRQQQAVDDERQWRRKMLSMQMLKGGYKEDASGNMTNPLEQQQQQAQMEDMDPNSARSVKARAFTGGLLEATQPGLGKTIPENMSAAELREQTKEGLLGKQVSGIYGMQGRQLSNNRMMDRLDLQRDNQAASAAGVFDKDPLLQSTQRQLSQIGVDRHTLQSSKIVTPQMVHEIGAGIAAALNQGKSAGLGQMEMQDMGTSATKIAQLEQYLFNKPEDGASPEIKQQILDTLDRLEESYKKTQGARASQVAQGRSYAHNPNAQKAIADKLKLYTPQGPGLQQSAPPTGLIQAPAMTPEDQQAIQWAQQNPNDPRAVKILQLHGMGGR